MSLHLPQTFSEWLPLLVPLLTVLIGLACLLTPGLWMRLCGLQPGSETGRGVGEIRSRFAGPFLGAGSAALAFQQPILIELLGVAWALAAAGRAVNIALGLDRSPTNMARALLAGLFAALCLSGGFTTALAVPSLPVNNGQWQLTAAAAATLALGVTCWIRPARVLASMELTERGPGSGAEAEPRAELAGFLVAIGGFALLAANPFALVAAAGCWMMTALGRILSMANDGNLGWRDWGMLAVEAALAAIFTLSVFGVI